MSILSSLFKRVIRLNDGTDVPPWQIQIWDDATHTWISWASTTTGSGGSPVTAKGLNGYPVSEAVCFPGDPPDLVNFGGDLLYLRSWQPDFITTASGDLLIAEGLD